MTPDQHFFFIRSDFEGSKGLSEFVSRTLLIALFYAFAVGPFIPTGLLLPGFIAAYVFLSRLLTWVRVREEFRVIEKEHRALLKRADKR